MLNTSNLTINIIYFVKFKKGDNLYCSLFVLVYGDTTILLSVTKLNLQNLLNVFVYFWGVGGGYVIFWFMLLFVVFFFSFVCFFIHIAVSLAYKNNI